VFRRRQLKSHGELLREELGESLDHLRMAAAHAADGAAGALAPRVVAAREAVKPGLRKASGYARAGADSLFTTAREGSRQARRRATRGKASKKETGMAGKRWPMVIGGLLATGAVIGAASALMRRRRSGRAWDEYSSTRTTADKSMIDSARTAMDAGVHKASPTAESAKERTSDLIGSAKSTANDRMGSGTPGEYKQQRDEMYGRTGTSATGAPSSTSAGTNSRQ
jgi:gas vesicle protein